MLTNVFVPFLLLMLSGTLWGFIPHAPDRAKVRAALAAVVLNIFLPALTFSIIYRAPVSRELWAVPAVSIGACLALVVVSLGLYELLYRIRGKRLPARSHGALVLSAAWSNATYLGLPVVTALFGAGMGRVPILFDLLAMTPLLLTVGVMIGTRYGAGPVVRPGAKTEAFWGTLVGGAATVLKLPPFWACNIALAMNLAAIPVPAVFLRACELAGSAVAPMMIFAVGLALNFSSPRRLFWILPATTLKLVVQPALALVIAGIVGLQGVSHAAAVIEAAMPTMVLTMVVADRYSLDSELLAQSIALSTVLSFVTVPAIAHLLGA